MLFFKKSLPPRDFYGGLIGCGYFVKYAYVPALNNPDNPIVCCGLYSRSPGSAKIVQKMLDYKTRIFASYEELVNSGIKFVIIATPNYLHHYYATESLKRNLDVFCEKPLTVNLEEACNLKSILEGSENILMVGFNQRYSEKIKMLKSLIEDNEVGRITEATFFLNLDIEKHILKSDWLNDQSKSGGGVLYNAGIHWINVMLHIFGKIEKVRTDFRNIKLPHACGEDTAYCRFIFRSGMRGFLGVSFVNALHNFEKEMTIKGDRGVIHTNMHEESFFLRDNAGRQKIITCQPATVSDSIYNELGHFYYCIKTKKIPDTDTVDYVETLKVVEAARVSALEKRDVLIDEIDKRYV
jgi:predicted dehydrogenase